jgi:Fic family protein
VLTVYPIDFIASPPRLNLERKAYYNQLERQQRGSFEITCWLEWFLDCLERAISNADTILSNVLLKFAIWRQLSSKPVNERQRLILNRMLEDNFEGYMNTSQYAKLAKCSNDTALRDIQDLKERSIFIQNPGGGRSTSYRLPATGYRIKLNKTPCKRNKSGALLKSLSQYLCSF